MPLSPETATPADLPLPFARFTLLDVLGAGGMGRVFKAVMTGPSGFRKDVALKVISPRDPDALAEIRAGLSSEARIGGLLRHPNVVDVYDFGEDDGRPWISMELVLGLDLADLSRRTRLAPLHILQIGAAIAAGLEHAHNLQIDGRRAGLVHRDLKPSNVLVSRDGVIKVMDFGIAKLASEGNRTEAGVAKGTPAFMSPEQASAEPMDHRSDLWSLGAILYQLATGEPLLRGSTIIELMMALLQAPERLARPGAMDPVDAVVPGLGALLGRLLRRDPKERPSTAAAVEDALLALQAHCPPAPSLRAVVREVLAGGDGLDLMALPTRVAADALTATLDSGPPTNLGSDDSSFLGRQEPLQRLRASMEESRLVTLLGSGGTGKSRLAREFARSWLPRVPVGGAWFVPLDEARSLDGILHALGRTLNLPLTDRDARSQVERVGQALAGRGPMLLVLDNFEQILALAGASVGRWLALAPELRVIVTSRERLRLPGEKVLPLGPLSPEDGAALFVDRATAARPSFALGPGDEATVADLVRRLDAIPLAIELAAARVALLPLDRLAQRLSQRFRLLRSQSADDGATSARKATLEGAIAWSWDLLDPAERHTLAACSVFRGGFTVELAEALVDLSSFPSDPWVLDTVEALRDKSLLRLVDSAGGPRFSMYESISAFAAARLEEHGHTDALRRRHVEVMLGWVTPLTLQLHGASAPAALLAIGRELENLVTAWEFAAESAPEQAARLGLAMETTLRRRGPGTLYERVIGRSVELSAGLSRELQAELASAESQLSRILGRNDVALAAARRAVAMAEETGDEVLAATYCISLGYSLRSAEHAPEIEERQRAALALLRQRGERKDVGLLLSSLASTVGHLGRAREERALRREALTLHEEAGNARMVAAESANLGILIATAGAVQEAEPLFLAAVRGFREAHDRMAEQVAAANLASLYAELGRVDDAERMMLRAQAGARELGVNHLLPLISCNLGLLAISRGRNAEARAHLQTAGQLFAERQSDVRLEGLQRAYVGTLELLDGHPDIAVEALRAGAETIRDSWAQRDYGMSLLMLVAAHAQADDEAAALATLEEARPVAERLDDEDCRILITFAEGQIELARARAAEARGEHDDAALLREMAEARLDMVPMEGAVRASMTRIGHRLLAQSLAPSGSR